MLNKMKLGIRYLWGVVKWLTTDETMGYIGYGLRVGEKLFGNESNKEAFAKARRVQQWVNDRTEFSKNTVVLEIANQIDQSQDPDLKDYTAKVQPDKHGPGNDGITIGLKDGKITGGIEFGMLKAGLNSDGEVTVGLNMGQ